MKQNRWTKVAPWASISICLVWLVMLIAVGAQSGEMQLVLTKAINICMECIGIG